MLEEFQIIETFDFIEPDLTPLTVSQIDQFFAFIQQEKVKLINIKGCTRSRLLCWAWKMGCQEQSEKTEEEEWVDDRHSICEKRRRSYLIIKNTAKNWNWLGWAEEFLKWIWKYPRNFNQRVWRQNRQTKACLRSGWKEKGEKGQKLKLTQKENH